MKYANPTNKVWCLAFVALLTAGCTESPSKAETEPAMPEAKLLDITSAGNVNSVYGGAAAAPSRTAIVYSDPEAHQWQGLWQTSGSTEPARHSLPLGGVIQGFGTGESTERLWFTYRVEGGDVSLGWLDEDGMSLVPLTTLLPRDAAVQGSPRMWPMKDGVLVGVFSVAGGQSTITVIQANDGDRSVGDFTRSTITGVLSGNAFVVGAAGQERFVLASEPGMVNLWRSRDGGPFSGPEKVYMTTDPLAMETLQSPEFLPSDTGDARHALLQNIPVSGNFPTGRAYEIQMAKVDEWGWKRVPDLIIERSPVVVDGDAGSWVISVDGTRLIQLRADATVAADETIPCRLVALARGAVPLAIMGAQNGDQFDLWTTQVDGSSYEPACASRPSMASM